MANSLFTGVTGLRVHQQMLDVVGNNLANSNTTGFKGQRVRFADLVYQTGKSSHELNLREYRRNQSGSGRVGSSCGGDRRQFAARKS